MSMDSNLQLVLASIANSIKARNMELVSGTNIKTVNGDSILGSGDLMIPTYANTVSSSNVWFVKSGNRAFTVNTLGAFKLGSRVRVIDNTMPTRWMEGTITFVNSDTLLVLSVDASSDTSGSSNDWTFVIAGEKGSTTSSVVIQAAEPSVPIGNRVLWIETMANGNFNCWIKTG